MIAGSIFSNSFTRMRSFGGRMPSIAYIRTDFLNLNSSVRTLCPLQSIVPALEQIDIVRRKWPQYVILINVFVVRTSDYVVGLCKSRHTPRSPVPFPSEPEEMKPPTSAFIAAVKVPQSADESSDTCTGLVLELGVFAVSTLCTSLRTEAVMPLSVPSK